MQKRPFERHATREGPYMNAKAYKQGESVPVCEIHRWIPGRGWVRATPPEGPQDAQEGTPRAAAGTGGQSDGQGHKFTIGEKL